MRKFLGSTFNWFIGVVEDRTDPKKLGRVRVRAYGYNTDDKGELPTDELPWASIILSPDSASISGIGKSPTGIVEGSWVFGFFIDGKDAQQPAILGTLPGMPSEKSNSAFGFNDPTEKFPRYINEPDTNKLARGENLEIHAVDELIKEPERPYRAEYPYNHVYETESGHIREYDDTKGYERIREKHKSGTFYEIHPTGDKVEHIKSDNYRIVAGEESVHIRGNVNLFVDGDVNLRVKGNYKANIGGRCDFVSGGNMRFIAPRIDWNPELQEISIAEETENIISVGETKLDVSDKYDFTIKPRSSSEFKNDCPEIPKDEQTKFIQKIVDEIFLSSNWTNIKLLTEKFKSMNPKTRILDNLEDTAGLTGGEEGVTFAVIVEDLSHRKSNPKLTKWLIPYYNSTKAHNVARHKFIVEMVKEIQASNCDAEELYNLLLEFVDMNIPIIPMKNLLTGSMKTTDPDAHPKSYEQLNGGWFRPPLDIMILTDGAKNKFSTFVHELGGHDFHDGKWGSDGLLTEKEVDGLDKVFTMDIAREHSNGSSFAQPLASFVMLGGYSRAMLEDEFLARVLPYLALNKCETFEEDIYPTLNRFGVKFTLKTIKAIDAEMVKMGLNRKVRDGYKPPADITYLEDDGAVPFKQLFDLFAEHKPKYQEAEFIADS